MAANGENGKPKPKKIFMWMVPRSLSTSFEKCVGFIDGAQVWHEPYVSCYFNEIAADPKTFQIFPKMQIFFQQFQKAQKAVEEGHFYTGGNLSPAQNFTYDWVKEQLEKPVAEGKEFMFIKDAAFSVDGKYDKLPEVDAKHTFIIRHPNRHTYSSRRGMIGLYQHQGDPDEFDLSTGHPFTTWERLSPDPLYKLFKHIRENVDPNPIIIDADDLQNHPEQMLRKYLEAVGIPFKKEYVKWDKSPESLKNFHGSLEQMIWGHDEHIYDAAFLSGEFLPITKEIPKTVPDKCLGYMEQFEEGYKVMYEMRIKPE